MLAVMASRLRVEHHIEQPLAKWIDFVEHELGPCPFHEPRQRAGPRRGFQYSLAFADRRRARGEGRVRQRGRELLQADLLLGAAGFGQKPHSEVLCVTKWI